MKEKNTKMLIEKLIQGNCIIWMVGIISYIFLTIIMMII